MLGKRRAMPEVLVANTMNMVHGPLELFVSLTLSYFPLIYHKELIYKLSFTRTTTIPNLYLYPRAQSHTSPPLVPLLNSNTIYLYFDTSLLYFATSLCHQTAALFVNAPRINFA